MARRYAILTEGHLLDRRAKTAHGVIQYGRDEIAAVIDSAFAGQDVRVVLPRLGRSGPIVASLRDALAYEPTSLLLGVANQGGFIPEGFRPQILDAIDAGLEIVSGLHQLLRDDSEFVARAQASGSTLWDVRVPPAGIPLFSGAAYRAPHVIALAVGSDCAVGKKSVMIELDRAARAGGDATEFVATGQTGTLIAGKGIVVDRVISDFITGAAERLVLGVAPDVDVALVEGQGSLWHPAYAPVTLGLLFGCAPDLLIMCIDTTREEVEEYGVKLPPLLDMIRAHEALVQPIKPARVAAVAVNTATLSDAEARDAIARAQTSSGLPADDVVRFGGARLWRAVREAAERTDKWRARVPAAR